MAAWSRASVSHLVTEGALVALRGALLAGHSAKQLTGMMCEVALELEKRRIDEARAERRAATDAQRARRALLRAHPLAALSQRLGCSIRPTF